MIEDLAQRLGRIAGVAAVALGGSRARGTHRPDSDFDLGIFYREASPFRIEDVKQLAAELSDLPDPVVTDFGRWGRWVNGGAWLTIRGQRVDFIYRNLDDLARVFEACQQGQIEWDFGQQPPYGFHSYVYLGELSAAQALYDPDHALRRLKERLVPYPPRLKRAIINRLLWGCEFDLTHAKSFAQRGDVYNAAGCLTRIACQLVQVLYALNEQYFVNDKGALDEIERFSLRPDRFASILTRVLACPGATSDELVESARGMGGLVEETARLCGRLYARPEFHA